MNCEHCKFELLDEDPNSQAKMIIHYIVMHGDAEAKKLPDGYELVATVPKWSHVDPPKPSKSTCVSRHKQWSTWSEEEVFL